MISDINLRPLREGKRDAVMTIYDRVRNGESHTAVVLPTRYGKSDVMRVAGTMLKEAGLVSRAVVLVPTELLRTQFVAGAKWDEAESRYNLPRVRTAEVVRAPSMPFPRENAEFVAMTLQMANQHANLLARWVESEIQKSGVPPIFFVDEAHTGSEDNSWGHTVHGLSEVGARVALLTATPYRSDERPIPGFERELIDIRDAWKTHRSGHTIDVFEGKRKVYQLRAHHTTKFRDAWATEPAVLCHINRIGFDVVVERMNGNGGGNQEERLLSNLPQDRALRVLTNELRKPDVVMQACKLLVDELANRRKAAPTSAAILFVGNDQPDDEFDNQHAHEARRAIYELDRSLQVIIATSTTKGANDDIARFADGTGDILIVKQMAGIGLDVDRLKVCLDLSNVRQAAAFIQRTTRIATIWDRRQQSGKDWDIVTTATYIAPDDKVGLGLFQRFITDQGGETTETEWSHVGTSEADSSPPPPILDYDAAKQVIVGDNLYDSHRLVAPGEALEPLKQLHTRLPRLAHLYTNPQIWEGLTAAGMMRDETSEPRPHISPSISDISPEGERDVTREQAAISGRLNKLAKRIAQRRKKHTRPEDHGQIFIRVWVEHKKAVGVHPATKLKDIPDTATLKQLEQSMLRELKRNTQGSLV